MNFEPIVVSILAIIAVIFLVTTIVNASKAKEEKEKRAHYKNQYFKLKESYSNLTHEYNEAGGIINDLRSVINKLENRPPNLDRLRFKFKDGETANNVKVKTILKEKEVVGIKATVRKKVEGSFTDVPVFPVLIAENEVVES